MFQLSVYSLCVPFSFYLASYSNSCHYPLKSSVILVLSLCLNSHLSPVTFSPIVTLLISSNYCTCQFVTVSSSMVYLSCCFAVLGFQLYSTLILNNKDFWVLELEQSGSSFACCINMLISHVIIIITFVSGHKLKS